MTAASPAWPGSRATTWTPPLPRLRSWWPTDGNIAASRASSFDLSQRGLELWMAVCGYRIVSRPASAFDWCEDEGGHEPKVAWTSAASRTGT
jgi:hypothetical protein